MKYEKSSHALLKRLNKNQYDIVSKHKSICFGILFTCINKSISQSLYFEDDNIKSIKEMFSGDIKKTIIRKKTMMSQ